MNLDYFKNPKSYIYGFFFIFFSYFNLHIFKYGNFFFEGNLVKIIFLSCILSLFSTAFIYYFFFNEHSEIKLKNLIKKKTDLKKKKKNFYLIIVLFFIISTFSLWYVEYIQKNNLKYLFYEISTNVKFSFPFNYLWAGKNFFSSILYSFSVFIFYYIMRFFKISRFISIFFSFAFCISQTHLYNLITSPFRDYIKGPIILLLILIFIKIIFSQKESNFKFNILLASIILYFGFFLKSDILIYHLIFLFIFFFKFFENLFNKKFVNKIFYKVFFGYLIINISHIVSLIQLQDNSLQLPATFISTVNQNLFIYNESYDTGSIFIDEYIRNLKTFDKNYLIENIYYFPLDLLIKVIANFINILNLPFQNRLPPIGLESELLENFYYFKFLLLHFFKHKIILFFIFFCILVTLNFNIKGWILIIIIFINLTYPIIQHSIKHYFYLEIIPLLCLACTMQFFYHLLKKCLKNI